MGPRETSTEFDSLGDIERSGSDTWIVTFGDTMSLLLTFFVLLISFSFFEAGTIPLPTRDKDNFIGGGMRQGDSWLKKNFNIARKDLGLDDDAANVKLADESFFVENESYVETFGKNRFQKMNERLKKMMTENPALLSVLIQK